MSIWFVVIDLFIVMAGLYSLVKMFIAARHSQKNRNLYLILSVLLIVFIGFGVAYFTHLGMRVGGV